MKARLKPEFFRRRIRCSDNLPWLVDETTSSLLQFELKHNGPGYMCEDIKTVDGSFWLIEEKDIIEFLSCEDNPKYTEFLSALASINVDSE